MRNLARAALAAAVLTAIGSAAEAQDDDGMHLFLLRELRLDVDEIGAGEFTAAMVPPDAPFGDIPVDYNRTDNRPLAAFLLELGSGQRIELIQRCWIVVRNQSRYRNLDVAYCHSVHGIIRRPMA